MDVENRLRNSLIRKIQQLSTDKLTELNKHLKKIEDTFPSKDKTLRLAGSRKEMEEDLFADPTVSQNKNSVVSMVK